ncbi:uncharacterized protein EI90DRAFT_3116772 [Cantharellus anzutake]|uniref:uncharacterized protein n=1 Tax=Cantharellus anzutake TaxID=1750568 RepID=UPI001908CEB9|nr:uncharacterized protein EI90DRAFT_3116772 [Cantharellus anzutake]KAF8341668.1 hypothetical protein EI90DRAFT_3116772 [Cantharellus anzutake]
MEVTHLSKEELEDSLEDKPENNSGDSEVSSFEVEDPYEGPQYSPDSEGEEVNIGTIRMGPMSVVDHNDTNYRVELAVTRQLEESVDKKVAECQGTPTPPSSIQLHPAPLHPLPLLQPPYSLSGSGPQLGVAGGPSALGALDPGPVPDTEALVETPKKDALGTYMKEPKKNKGKGKKDHVISHLTTPSLQPHHPLCHTSPLPNDTFLPNCLSSGLELGTLALGHSYPGSSVLSQNIQNLQIRLDLPMDLRHFVPYL